MAIKKVIIDFDDTLFNTQALKLELARVFGKYGISQEKFAETYLKIYQDQNGRAQYDVVRHLDLLSQEFKTLDKEKILAEINQLLKGWRLAGVPEFLSALKQKDFYLILLSLGGERFQKRKIEAAGIKNYFDEIITVDEPKIKILKDLIGSLGEEIIFINDKIKETQEAKAVFPSLKPILLMREDIFPLSDYQNSGLPYFKTFSEIIEYMNKL